MISNPVITINHDPFARQSLVRQACDYTIAYTCKWCGQKRVKQGGSARHMYHYGMERDARGGVSWHQGEFCCLSCHNAYHS